MNKQPSSSKYDPGDEDTKMKPSDWFIVAGIVVVVVMFVYFFGAQQQ